MTVRDRPRYMIAARINSPNGPQTHRAWNNRAAEADAFGKALGRLQKTLPKFILGVAVYDMERGLYRYREGERVEL